MKTRRFANPSYVGDPQNTVGIFSEMEVDELFILDIGVAKENHAIDWPLLEGIATASFMPFGYGGGVTTTDDVARLHALGAEKVILNTAAFRDRTLVERVASRFGSQTVVVSVDVVGTGDAARVLVAGTETSTEPVEYARAMQECGAGELLLTSVDREGTFEGYDVDLVRRVTETVSIPVVANGGCANLDHVRAAVLAGASGAAAGSMVVFQGPNRAVLVNYPTRAELRATFA
ncbi:MAG: nitronate monooxygenase [Labilithrix sp.]|nr:nitronate monooxygenase [Labilithrix sp.]